jgi:hypothetical protein
MTRQEFNRDIRRLRKRFHTDESKDYGSPFRKEFERLYYADKEFTYASVESIKTLLRINLRLRYIPLHLFGIYIEL